MIEPAPDPDVDGPVRSRPVRILYLALGWLCFGLGIVGAILPLLPATPFMLLALGAFARGSRRLELWLLHHKLFGPPLRSWRAGRVIPLKVKMIAWGSMAISFGLATASGRLPWWALAAFGALCLAGTIFIARCPSRLPDQQ